VKLEPEGRRNVMLKRIGLRLSYANVMATGAMFFALAGGTYALTGVPDQSGVFHGCVSNQTGALRIVRSASSCRHARVRHRHRELGEFAVAWNQKGRPGAKGIRGARGLTGAKGPKGSTGPTGATGINGAPKVTVKTASGSPAKGGELSQVAVACNPGEQVTGGGAEVDRDTIAAITASAPNGSAWVARARNTASEASAPTVTVKAFVICAAP
jgi:hypothetical protein